MEKSLNLQGHWPFGSGEEQISMFFVQIHFKHLCFLNEKRNKHCIRYPRKVLVNKENGQVYKAVILSIINFLASNFFMQMFNVTILCRLSIRLFHQNVQCVYIVQAKYQIVSSKAVVRVDWPVYALFKHKHNPCLKASWKKWLSSQSCHFVNKFFGTKLLHANIQCVYIV